jgi:hypothetical protein
MLEHYMVKPWAEYNTRRVQSQQEIGIDFAECIFGGKECHYGHWTELYWSEATGWSQVLYWCENPQSDIVILRINYYDSALAAIRDASIFPPNAIVAWSWT